jgi:putative FmdB family regulatory protein
MPTYEYKCDDCNHHFEKSQGMTETPVKICPECGGTVKRLVSAGSGFILKGSQSNYRVPECGASSPCCGADTVCNVKPCK